MSNYPTVSLLIVVRNEVNHIKNSLNSFLAQDYPKEKIEIIIVDGMSNDGTREYIFEQLKIHPELKLLDNPNKILASGWNIGIKAAKGEFVCRIDAHSKLSEDYILNGVNELEKNDQLISVGGVIKSEGTNNIGKIIADLFSSKFGVGNSYFRIGVEEKTITDTACYGVYRKKIFYDYGFFDETLARNQDIELHKRLLNKGYKFLTHPDMKIMYYVRSSIKKLLKKGYGDGFWVAYSNSYYLRHLIPLFFLIYLITLITGLLIFKNTTLKIILLTPLFLYILLAIFFGIKDGSSTSSKIKLPILFFQYHIVYGIGSLVGFLKKVFN